MVKFIELESRLMVTGGWGVWAGRERTDGESVFNGCRVSVGDDEKVLERDDGDG